MSHDLTAPAGSVLFRPGDACPGFLRLKRGEIRVTMTGENGREVLLYRVRPGDVCLQTFSCLVEGRPYSAEGLAVTDIAGELIPPTQFEPRLAEDAAFRKELLQSVALRFGDVQALIEDAVLTEFDARLARVLLRMTDAAGRISATHDDIALEAASGRAAVSRKLASFARQGLVETERGALRIVDKAGLERMSRLP